MRSKSPPTDEQVATDMIVHKSLRLTDPDAAGSGLELAVPASINCQMHEYQRDGVRFLFRQYARGVGGILADDMVCPRYCQQFVNYAVVGKSLHTSKL